MAKNSNFPTSTDSDKAVDSTTPSQPPTQANPETKPEQPPAVDVTELVARQKEMEAQLAALQSQIAAASGGGSAGPVSLHGPANPRAETEHRATFWPHDAERQLAPVKTRTYRVTPLAGAENEGWPVAVVDRCYDANDAKAAYLRNKKIELHGLPLKIELVSEETYQPEGRAA